MFWVGGTGSWVTTIRKFRNVAAGAEQVALVVDDVVSSDPFAARGVRIYGVATGPVERVGMMGPESCADRFRCGPRQRAIDSKPVHLLRLG